MKSGIVFVVIGWMILWWPAHLMARLPAGFMRLIQGRAHVVTRDRGVDIGPAEIPPIALDDVIRTGEGFEGRLLLFDGSSVALRPLSTAIISSDGVFVDTGGGHSLVHGFRVPLTAEHINSPIPPTDGSAVSWVSTRGAFVGEEQGQAVQTDGSLLVNQPLTTDQDSVAKIEYGPRGIIVLRGATTVRLVPGGYSLVNGGVLVELGSRQETGLWTGQAVLRSTRAFLEATSVGGVDTFRVLRGRVVVQGVLGERWRRTLRAGMSLVVSAAEGITVERFKPSRDAERLGGELLERVRKPLLDGFGTGERPVLSPPVARQEDTEVRRESVDARRISHPGQDFDGLETLNPLSTKIPGSDPADWVVHR